MVRATPAPDPVSRRTVAGFALRLGVLAAVATSPCLLGFRPPGDALAALQLACAMGALFSVARAARRGDRLGRVGLNAWDEAAAFWAGLMLLHALARLHAYELLKAFVAP